MRDELMPRLARLTKVHGLFLDGKDLVVQCATNTVERGDLSLPIAEALRLCEWLSKLPYSIALNTDEYSVTYEPMPLLAQLTKAHAIVSVGTTVVVQCATATVEWTDITIPMEEAVKLREKLSTLLSSFAPRKKAEDGKPERVLRFPRPVSLEAVLEIQRFHYRANRYMQALTREELGQRLQDVMANVMTLRDDGKYTLLTPKRNGMHSPTRNIDFLLLYTELGEEFLIRGLLNGEQSANPPEKIRRLDDESWCRRPEWVNASQHSRESYFNKPKMLFKVGKAEHMRALYERGEVFVKPASAFALADGAARQDDELTKSWYREGQKIEFTTSDYYCWCCASVYDYRLFWDFQSDGKPADACLAIRDPDSFIERLATAVAAQVSDVERVRLIPAYYYDPLSVSDDPAEFGAYQDEAIQCAIVCAVDVGRPIGDIGQQPRNQIYGQFD
ncbi:hypothetical protein ACRQ5Q_42780 (plasmid) [Bradyrhizobium sp. PMVTL-01]|uniref:hypothetical protein n=1 Tax=Bradyrhizobium sp. PMVTL-01 TaxID=3434999 RepID=UPI003F71DC4F